MPHHMCSPTQETHFLSKGYFPLAECNELSGKCFFSHTTGSLVIAHVTEGQAVAFVASTITDLPTHPP